MPTYTELYYEDPVTLGNPELKHEESINYEIGSIYKTNQVEFSLSFFRKEGENIIDYIKLTEEDKWEAQNILKTYTNGIEIGLTINPDLYSNIIPVTGINLSYTYLDSDRYTEGFESRYVLEYLKHKLITNIIHSFFFNIDFNWYLRYEKRIEFDDNFLTDLNISKKINHLDFYIKVTNLFNVYYEDIAEVPLPGMWVVAGINFSLNEF